MVTRYVNTASTAGGDGTTNNTTGATRAYASLSEFEAALPEDITGTDSYEAVCTGSNADVGNNIFNGTATDATHYILVRQATSDRAGAEYNTGRYRLSASLADGYALIECYDRYVRFDGIQFFTTGSVASSTIYGLYIAPLNATNEIRVEHCIFGASLSSTAKSIGIHLQTAGVYKISNNVFFDFVNSTNICRGVYGAASAVGWVYNNTFRNCFRGSNGDGLTFINNIYSTTDAPAGTVLTACDYNVTDQSSLGTYYRNSGGSNTHDHTSHTFTFASSTDAHLASTDAGAIGFGVDLSGDANYAITDDIDYVTRSGTWDCGADQYVASGETSSISSQSTNSSISSKSSESSTKSSASTNSSISSKSSESSTKSSVSTASSLSSISSESSTKSSASTNSSLSSKSSESSTKSSVSTASSLSSVSSESSTKSSVSTASSISSESSTKSSASTASSKSSQSAGDLSTKSSASSESSSKSSSSSIGDELTIVSGQPWSVYIDDFIDATTGLAFTGTSITNKTVTMVTYDDSDNEIVVTTVDGTLLTYTTSWNLAFSALITAPLSLLHFTIVITGDEIDPYVLNGEIDDQVSSASSLSSISSESSTKSSESSTKSSISSISSESSSFSSLSTNSSNSSKSSISQEDSSSSESSEEVVIPSPKIPSRYTDYSDLPDRNFFVANSPIYNAERQLYDSLLTEAFNKFGVDMVYYIVSFDTEYDEIFKEDRNREFLRKFDVMGYYELPREEELWSQFGIEGLDNFKIYISKQHFKTASLQCNNRAYRPKAGDVIKAKYNDLYYRILTVKEEVNMFLQRKHTWELTVEKFKDMGESIVTSAGTKMNELNDINDLFTDIFSISATVGESISAVDFNTDGEISPDPVWGTW